VKPNVALIGMPASGKSTLGPLLAAGLGWSFLDTDKELERVAAMPLQKMVESLGDDEFRRREDALVQNLNPHHHVIATGGSVIYGAGAMAHLKGIAVIAFLDVAMDELHKRIQAAAARGIVWPAALTFDELYASRQVMYRHYADIIFDATHRTPAECCEQLFSQLEANGA
jgi:shikimate kinase